MVPDAPVLERNQKPRIRGGGGGGVDGSKAKGGGIEGGLWVY